MPQSFKTEVSPPKTNLVEYCFTALRVQNKSDVVNHRVDNQWHHLATETFIKRVRAVTLALIGLSIKKGDRIALLSENRPEWSIIDFAILSLGAVNVPIYTTQAPEQVDFILKDSLPSILFVSNRRLFKHARIDHTTLSTLKRIIFLDETNNTEEREISFRDFERDGADRDSHYPQIFDLRLRETIGEDLATIIYTSGTTGDPKGVMLTHNNFIANVSSICQTLPFLKSDTALSVLPLSHIFERTAFYVFCCAGVSVYYCASFDQVGELMAEVKPTIMTAVPRLFEKVYHRIIKKTLSARRIKRKLGLWAIEIGEKRAVLENNALKVAAHLALKHKIADTLVFSKWRQAIGGRLRFFISGGAPLAPHLSHAFLSAGIHILQGYGMTETCIVSANRPDNNKVGSVGIPFPGVEVRIAPDGEILLGGPSIMQGYYRRDEDTAAAFTEDGWFMTGDVGHLDEENRLYITDRKKELFKLSNGKYVSPLQIESLIKQSRFVAQVLVVGAGRKQPVAIIAPDWSTLTEELSKTGSLNHKVTHEELAKNPAAVALVQQEVAGLCSTLLDYERVRKIALIPSEFTIDGGELTPTLKVKRAIVEQKYAQVIEDLYQSR